MLKKIAIGLAVVVGAVLLYAASKPNEFRVSRSAVIHAPPARIYPLIDNFHAWNSWSPYDKMDPAMKRTFTGAPEGKGAVYGWEGNDKVGVGRMEILEDSTPTSVTVKLDFFKPFEAHNTAQFTLTPRGESTEVTWAMSGPSAYLHKVVGLFLNMDSLVGHDFETGLNNLKTLTEK
jgi:hypothetical protein